MKALTMARTRAIYVLLLFALPSIAQFGHYIAPNQPVFKGHDWGVLATFAVLGAAGLLWIPYRAHGAWPWVPAVAFAIMGSAWAFQLLSIQLDDSLFAISTVAVLASLAMMWNKPASPGDIRLAGLTLGYSIIIIAALSLVFGGLGVLSDGFRGVDSGANRLILTNELLGIGSRWGGPFGSVNLAAPAGGLVVILGLCYRGWHRWLLIASGALILVLSQGRTAIFATVIALLVFIAWSQGISRLAHAWAIRVAILIGGLLTLAGYVVVADPTFAGRTPIWAGFWTQWTEAPLTGVGQSGVLNYLDALVIAQPGVFPHNHAHNVLLDVMVKYGVILAIAIIAIYALALLSTYRGIAAYGAAPWALAVYVIAAGLAETVYSLVDWSFYLAALALVIMWTSPARIRRDTPDDRRPA